MGFINCVRTDCRCSSSAVTPWICTPFLPPLPVTSYQWDSGRKHFFHTLVFQSPLFPFNEENVWIAWETVVSFPHPWKVVQDFSSGGQLCSHTYRQEELGAAGDRAQAAELGAPASVLAALETPAPQPTNLPTGYLVKILLWWQDCASCMWTTHL